MLGISFIYLWFATSYSKFNMVGDRARTLDVRLPSLMGVF